MLARERTSRATGRPLNCDYRMVASDGREIWVRDEALVVNEQGRPVLHGVIHDVTDQMRAQIVLKERSAELAQTVPRADERPQRGRARDRLSARGHGRDAGR